MKNLINKLLEDSDYASVVSIINDSKTPELVVSFVIDVLAEANPYWKMTQYDVCYECSPIEFELADLLNKGAVFDDAKLQVILEEKYEFPASGEEA